MRRLRKRIAAFFLLGFRLVLNLLRRPFQRPGKEKFERYYAPDNLFSFSEEERRRYHAFTRCIGCGLCEIHCAGLAGAPRVLPQALALSESRALYDLPSARAHAEQYLGCAACGACEAACPTGVPLREMASFVVLHGKRHEAETKKKTS